MSSRFEGYNSVEVIAEQTGVSVEVARHSLAEQSRIAEKYILSAPGKEVDRVVNE